MRGACARHIAWRMMTACSTYVTRDWLAATVGRRYVRPVPIETLVGTTLAGYTVRGKVGEGGTSTVFRAEHPQHGTVALKV